MLAWLKCLINKLKHLCFSEERYTCFWRNQIQICVLKCGTKARLRMCCGLNRTHCAWRSNCRTVLKALLITAKTISCCWNKIKGKWCRAYWTMMWVIRSMVMTLKKGAKIFEINDFQDIIFVRLLMWNLVCLFVCFISWQKFISSVL